ncbi:hypothetical protein I3843_03G019400 [Carya illinoinensis]|nr:hypothetical protein I3760_03G016300 [Carya illinoinensis]KAG7985314.1 hypothetical protein I3843_03G019400 [Carya illinoinensis]
MHLLEEPRTPARNPKVSCGKPSDPRYSSCVGKPKPTKCGKKTAYGRCKPPQGT